MGRALLAAIAVALAASSGCWADFPENYAAQTQMAWKKGRDHHLVRLRRGYPEPAWHHILAHEATHIDFETKARALGRNRWFTVNDETRRKVLR